MSSKTSIRLTDICADCSSLDPGWALVNRGLLICDECCSAHRSLGRHISQVKSIKRSHWSPSQLAMVHSLNNGGVNNLWEHSLPDMKSKRKPTPKDPVHPTKTEFIRQKYQDLLFVPKTESTEVELSQQLHSSVRSTNLETSLRLLAQGADPNYMHPEKGTRALHVAAKAGQLSQVELLIAHGANPILRDVNGNSPTQSARLGGHREVQLRLIECLYEVTDRLIYFLCKRRPDHIAGEHFILPDNTDCIVTPLQPSVEASMKLKQLKIPVFEDFVMDIYDEVDRRETEAIWQQSGASLELNPVPFLPMNPEFSRTRNQGRQKLATLSAPEFSALVLDILMEAKRRQALSTAGTNFKDDDEPLYDSVASDEDYATAEQIAILVAQNASGLPLNITHPNKANTMNKPLRGTVETLPQRSSIEKELREKLAQSESRLSLMNQKMQELTSKVEEITQENKELKRCLEEQSVGSGEKEPVLEVRNPPQRPVSMYETREPRQSIIGSMPHNEEVTRRTNQVTKRMQELVCLMKSTEFFHSFVPCAERIRVAVAELSAIFPQNPNDDAIRNALKQLNTSTIKLQSDCSHLERCAEDVRSSAFNVAQANRSIVTRF